MKSKTYKKVIQIGCDGTDFLDFHDLSEFQEDIKEINQHNLERLKEAIKKKFKAPIFIWKNKNKNWILDGHQRKKALTDLENEGWTIPFIPVVEIFEKTKTEAKKAILQFSSQHGDFNKKALDFYIEKYKIDPLEIVLRKSPLLFEDRIKNIYTKTIKTPNYEPKGKKPPLKSLFDNSKTKELVSKIKKSELPEEEKAFLIEAAQRHTVFNFKKIAEYYSHSNIEFQDLAEDQALVIIDFEKAIKNGFVILAEEIASQYLEEYRESNE